MRYFIAIIFATAGALVAMQFLSGPVASWAALHFKFDSSDDAENMNQLAFMAVNILGLVIGWTIGWAIGGPLSKGQRPT